MQKLTVLLNHSQLNQASLKKMFQPIFRYGKARLELVGLELLRPILLKAWITSNLHNVYKLLGGIRAKSLYLNTFIILLKAQDDTLFATNTTYCNSQIMNKWFQPSVVCVVTYAKEIVKINNGNEKKTHYTICFIRE